jgi:Pyruvate/2-oxoacid:ferredoxin oxidoreductase gamma subunit
MNFLNSSIPSLVYVGATNAVPPEVIEKGIAHKFAKNPKLIDPNVEAFRMGLEIGKAQAK